MIDKNIKPTNTKPIFFIIYIIIIKISYALVFKILFLYNFYFRNKYETAFNKNSYLFFDWLGIFIFS